MNRRGMLFAAAMVAALMALGGTAFACVTFMGKAEVKGDDGTTEVVGTGNSHGYCSDGRPTSAAAGHLDDSITIKVKPGECADDGALANHQLPEGTYQVRYNNELSYTYDGTYWNMISKTGCFHPDNTDTSSVLGTFDIDANGFGSWTGSLSGSDLKGAAPHFATPLTASNICIGASGKGMLAPYQLLAL